MPQENPSTIFVAISIQRQQLCSFHHLQVSPDVFCCQKAKKSRSLYNKPMEKSPLMALVIIGILVPKDPSLYQNSHVMSWLWQRFYQKQNRANTNMLIQREASASHQHIKQYKEPPGSNPKPSVESVCVCVCVRAYFWFSDRTPSMKGLEIVS